MKILWISLLIISNAFAFYNEEYVEGLKTTLQKDLKENYLHELNMVLGSCAEDPIDCLEQYDDVVTYTAENGKVCFPYTECGFYKCMEDKYHCKDVGFNYFKDLAYPTCNTYVKNIKKGWFSKKGIEWIFNVMVCLQKGLVDECEIRGNCPTDKNDPELQKKTCNHITEFTLEFHPGCYINSGVGVCNLPFKDKLNIWRTVAKFLTPREREEAYKVVFYCMRN